MLRISLLLLILLTGRAYTQDLKADLTKITQKVDTSEHISLVVGIKVYSKKGGKVVYSTNSEMYRNATAKLTVLGDQEYYSSKQDEIVVDNEDKMIVVKRKRSATATASKEDSKAADKSLQEIIKLISKSDEKEQKPVISCTNSSSTARVYKVTNLPTMKEMILTLNMDNLKLVSVTYEYLEESEYKGQYIVLNYQTFSNAAGDGAGKLKSSNYYTVENDKVKVASKYATYKIIVD